MKKVRASPTSYQRVACPHLGRAGVPNRPGAEPSDAHRCFLTSGSGIPIAPHHQAHRCLSPAWRGCYQLQAGVVAAAAVAVVPPDDESSQVPPDVAAPTLSLATQRLLSHTGRQRALLAAIQPVAVEAPPASNPAVARPVPSAAHRGRGGQKRLLAWTVAAIPCLLVALALGLLAGVALRPPPLDTQPAFAAALNGETGNLPLAALVEVETAPLEATPVATFAPVAEPPAASPVAPTLPPAPTLAATPGPIRPGPWPSEAATGAPDRIRAPRVGMDAPIVPVGFSIQRIDGQAVRFYEVASFAAGWHTNSSLPGFKGNVVLAGHHNTAGKVFEHVVALEPGDFVFVDVDGRTYPYLVVIKEIFPETTVSNAQRAENGRWIAQTPDERLTLVTCWPPTGNSHRVVVVAIPAR